MRFAVKPFNDCGHDGFMGLTMKINFALLFVICSIPAQAGDLSFQAGYQSEVNASPELERLLYVILLFFSSGYMKAIVSIALGVLGIGMIMNRGEPGIIKKFIPWFAGCIILLSLSSITMIMKFK